MSPKPGFPVKLELPTGLLPVATRRGRLLWIDEVVPVSATKVFVE